MMKKIILDGKITGINTPIFLIAEAGVNHNGDLELAKKLIDVAVEANVDAIKFQTFVTEKVFVKSTFKAEYMKKSSNDKESFEELVKKYEFTLEEFKILKEYCNQKGIIFLSTPYDETSVEWLEKLNISAYKISSGDLNNFPLLKLISSKKKPILLSTGMSNLLEIKETVDYLITNKVEELVIFQCTTNYPTPLREINLNVIDTYKKEFPNILLGFSDHSLGTLASIGAVAKGVKFIEKHITLDKNMEGPDHKASLNPEELKNWVIKIRQIEVALGSFDKFPSTTEKIISEVSRRSIVSLKDLKKGDIIQFNDIVTKRPAGGIPPNQFYKIIGKRVKTNIQRDKIIYWDDVE